VSVQLGDGALFWCPLPAILARDFRIEKSGGVRARRRLRRAPGRAARDFWDGMGVVAKGVEHLPHSEPPKVIIKSLNPEYQNYERDAEEVNIVGRVIWAAKRL
jgi:hypothetical protein